MKKNLKYLLIVVVIFIFIFSSKEVYAFKDRVLWDAQSRTHVETVPEAGDVIEVPEEVNQDGADYARTGIIRQFIKDMWDGSADENGWCYLTVAGVNRYMVALAPVFGVDGDFVDIYITNNGVSTVYPCIIVDSKDVWEAFPNEYPYVYNGIKYGHLDNATGKCKIVECILDPYDESNPLTDTLSGVTQIVHGGNIQEHPEGPVGLDGNYGSGIGVSNKKNTFTRKLGQIIRNGWVSLATLFESDRTGYNYSTVTISITK